MKKLLAIDGNSIINRAFYGIRPLTNREGIHTNAIYGMINIIMKQVEALSPDYLAVAFDVKKPTFRHEFYGEYKAGRHATPPELLEQIPYAKDCLKALGFNVLELAGYEADDILGTLAKMAEKEDCEAYVLTGDRDSLQLISEKTTVLLATNADTVTMNTDAFVEKYGVLPSQFVDVKALMGDSSDNIPGVPGIGEKTALKFISEYGTLEKLYEALPSNPFTPSNNKKLNEGRESAFMSQKLAQIFCEVPIIENLEAVARRDMDRTEVHKLFTKFEFSAFIKRFGLDGCVQENTEEQVLEHRQFDLVETDADTLLEKLSKAESFSFLINGEKTEFCDGGKIYLYSGSLSKVKAVFADENKKAVCYDVKHLYKLFDEIGVEFLNCHHDIMLGAYVLNPSEGSFDLGRICSAYAGNSDSEQNAGDIWNAYKEIDAKISANNQEKLLYEIEMPLAKVLFKMEKEGFCVSVEGLNEYGKRLESFEDELKERIYFHAGCEFNINSPKQLGEVLFEKMMLPTGKKTKSGYSTGADVLEKLKPYHPIIEDILDYRQVAKLKGTYAEGLVKVAGADGKIHTNFKQTGTATGRLSSTEPNLQNIPIKTELGREFRRYFVPRSDEYLLIDADYSQIELRLLADISNDRHMIDAFKSGEDIHTSTAAKVFGVELDDVTPELRKRAKAVNFGIVYGIGDFSLSQDLKITRNQAREYIDNYLLTYSGVDSYLKNIVKSAYESGYVTTAFGRRRYIPELEGHNKMLKKFGERVAMNSPIQGTAADIIKIAMINVDRKLREKQIDAKLILQVHDELIVEAHRDCADEALEILQNEMENAVKLSVPLDVEIGVGENWYDCK
ncbi:MAG: DNA polymerase I [Clostridia bacterium]|nr:DNA polymerase I [Clostridia bacterium]